MTENILSHNEMCRREGASLQRGMNFGLGGNHSVILMSIRPGAPYRDRLGEDGTVLVYEGHDHPKDTTCPNPKMVDQPGQLPSGKLTQNGRFHQAAQEFRAGRRSPERVRVYEKIKSGICSYNGIFHLIDSWQERDSHRIVFKFRLVAVEDDEDLAQPVHIDVERRRIIPTAVKLEVWKRD